MGSNLLVSLRKYRPRENSDPLENFITEAFAWTLNYYPEFGKFFLKRIVENLNDCSIEVHQNPVWSTQENFDGKYPDMFCKLDKTAFVFEHKAWSHLHSNQLENYRDFAKKNFSSDQYHLILITGGAYLHDQNPDLALCWYNIYKWIESWLNDPPVKSDKNLFILHDFLELLKNEGMGPPAAISHEAILSYHPSRDFKKNVKELIKRVKAREIWKDLLKDDCPIGYNERWERIGIHLLDGWYPGIFVGFMLDSQEHKVAPLNPQSPDCSIIIDFQAGDLPDYHKSSLYQAMIKQIEDSVQKIA